MTSRSHSRQLLVSWMTSSWIGSFMLSVVWPLADGFTVLAAVAPYLRRARERGIGGREREGGEVWMACMHEMDEPYAKHIQRNSKTLRRKLRQPSKTQPCPVPSHCSDSFEDRQASHALTAGAAPTFLSNTFTFS